MGGRVWAGVGVGVSVKPALAVRTGEYLAGEADSENLTRCALGTGVSLAADGRGWPLGKSGLGGM